nr:hypothetical protein [Tanacetum cinerariifolium]
MLTRTPIVGRSMGGGTTVGKALDGRSFLMDDRRVWVSEMNENGGFKGKDFNGINHKIPYTTIGTERGVFYLNKYDVKFLMLRKEVHKFCNGTLVQVQENLLKMLNENRLGHDNMNLKGEEKKEIDDIKNPLDVSSLSLWGTNGSILRKDCRMVVKEIVSRLLEEEEVNHFGKEKLEWWFEQDIDKEEERFEEDEHGGEISAQKRSKLLLSLCIMLRDTTKKALRIGSLKDGAKKFVAIALKLLMLSEVKKFSDGTLVKILENLIDMLSKNKLGSENKRLKGRDWTDYDVKSLREMLKKIDEILRHREQPRRLEEYVGGRPKIVNPYTFVRPL